MDSIWLFLGSTRWDARSLEFNFEINLVCLDVNLNAKLTELFTVKRQNAVPMIESEINSFLSSKKSETSFVVYFYFIFSGGGD
jgi:cardiolipin synthase